MSPICICRVRCHPFAYAECDITHLHMQGVRPSIEIAIIFFCRLRGNDEIVNGIHNVSQLSPGVPHQCRLRMAHQGVGGVDHQLVCRRHWHRRTPNLPIRLSSGNRNAVRGGFISKVLAFGPRELGSNATVNKIQTFWNLKMISTSKGGMQNPNNNLTEAYFFRN